MASGRNQSRFEMLISVAVGGLDKFNKLDKVTKSSAKSAALLGDALKITGTNAADAKQRFRDLKKSMTQYRDAEKELIRLGEKYARLNRSTAKDEDKRIEKLERLRHRISNYKGALSELGDKVNKIVPGFIKLDTTVRKHRGQQEKLETAIFKLGTAVSKASQVTRKSTARTKKNTAETKKNSAAHSSSAKNVKINAHAFNQLSQRITNAEHGFSGLRRRLGAIRNQLLVLAFATRALRDALGGAFQATKDMEAALKGLGSVATNTGQGFTAAQDAAKKLAKVGLISVKEAAAGLKNLLSAGFGLAEATQLMNTLTDAAAFNRQGTLQLGEAVVGATQGIKNQNSIMVDNAGITKNLSVMYKEYAATLGTTMGKLTEVQKRSAIFFGVMKEGSIFAGDASKALSTLQGALSKLSTTSFEAKAALGDALRPAIAELVTNFANASKFLEDYFKNTEKAAAVSKGASEVIKSLVDTFKLLINTVGGLLSLGKGFITMLGGSIGAITRYIVVMKIFNMLKARGAKRLKAISDEHTQWISRGMVRGRRTTAMYNKETKTMLFGWKALKVHIRLARLEMEAFNIAQGRAFLGMGLLGKGVSKVWTGLRNLVKPLLAIGLGFKNFFTVAKGAGTALTALRVGLMGLAAPIVKIIGIFMVLDFAMRGISKLMDKLSGASADRFTQALKDQEAAMKSVNKVFKQSQQRFRTTGIQAAGLGIDSSTMNAKLTDLDQWHKQYQVLNNKFNQSRSESDQETNKKLLDDHQKLWDEMLSQTIQAQAAIEQKIAAFNKTRMDLQSQYTDMIEDQAKKSGVKDLVEIETSLRELDRLESQFRVQRQTAGEAFKKTALVMEQQFKARRIFLEKELFAEKEKIMIVAENKIQSMRDTINQRWIRSEEKTVKRIKDTNEAARITQEHKIKNLIASSRSGLNEWVKVYQAEALKAKAAFEGTAMGIGTGGSAAVSAMGNVNLGETKTAIGAPKKGMLRGQSLADDFSQTSEAFSKGEISLKKYKQELTTMTWNMDQAEKQVTRLKIESGEYTTALGSLKGEIEAVKTSLNQSEEATAREAEVTEKVRLAKIKLGEDETKLLKLNDEGAAALTTLQQKQFLYNEEVRKAAVAMTLLKHGSSKNQIILKQLNQEWQKESVHEYNMALGKNVTLFNSVLPLWKQASDNAAQRAQNIQNLVMAQEQERDILNEKHALLEKQIGLQKLMMASGLGEEGLKMTEEQKNKEQEKLDIMNKQLEILGMEITAFEAIAALDLSNMKALFDKENFEDSMMAMGDMVEKGVNFANKWTMIGEKTNKERDKFNRKQKLLLDKGEIDIDQYNQLTTASGKFYNEKQKFEQAKFTANLMREVGKQIMAYAAKKAAASGNIVAGLAMLAGGGAAMMLIESQARKVEREAEQRFGDAENEFQRRQDEIMGVDEGGDGGEATRKFGGTIKAQSLQVSISPTVVIQGDTIMIGQGSVAEFGAELQALILDSTNEAIETGQVSLDGVAGPG